MSMIKKTYFYKIDKLLNCFCVKPCDKTYISFIDNYFQ